MTVEEKMRQKYGLPLPQEKEMTMDEWRSGTSLETVIVPPEKTALQYFEDTLAELNPSSIFLLSLILILITSQVCRKAKVFGILPAFIGKLFHSIVITRTELEKHWWHRLAKAIILGSTLVIFLVFPFLTDLIVTDGHSYYLALSELKYLVSFLNFVSKFLIASILWFLFLDSIVYRVILYVIYGKKSGLSSL